MIQPFVSKIICKSKNIESYVYLKGKSHVIPNGIDISTFQPGFKRDVDKLKILFLGDKNDPRKNFQLVKKSVELLLEDRFELITPFPIPHEKVSDYLKSSHILAFPSYMEGSPNLVKEAMACNCSVVATNVGDIEWLFGNEPGYFISDFTPEGFSNCLKQAIDYISINGNPNGRARIKMLKLSEEEIADKILSIYKSIL